MKILIVGLGSIAQKHITALHHSLNDFQIFALRSKSSQNVAGVTNVYSLNELDLTTIDFAIISNPTSEHFKSIQNLVQYRIPLFIEKPIFSKIGALETALVKQIEEQSIVTYVACNLRFLECISYFRDEILNKSNIRINEVNAYCGSFLPNWRPNTDYKESYSANADLGGGVEIDLIHELDYVFWFFGEPIATSKYVSSNSSIEINANDYANYLWRYKTFSANIILNYYRRIPKREIEILTENDVWRIDLLKNTIFKNEEVFKTFSGTILDTYTAQISFFLNSIMAKKLKFNTAAEAYKLLKLCQNA